MSRIILQNILFKIIATGKNISTVDLKASFKEEHILLFMCVRLDNNYILN